MESEATLEEVKGCDKVRLPRWTPDNMNASRKKKWHQKKELNVKDVLQFLSCR
jgi:hypothetical protein